MMSAMRKWVSNPSLREFFCQFHEHNWLRVAQSICLLGVLCLRHLSVRPCVWGPDELASLVAAIEREGKWPSILSPSGQLRGKPQDSGITPRKASCPPAPQLTDVYHKPPAKWRGGDAKPFRPRGPHDPSSQGALPKDDATPGASEVPVYVPDVSTNPIHCVANQKDSIYPRWWPDSLPQEEKYAKLGDSGVISSTCAGDYGASTTLMTHKRSHSGNEHGRAGKLSDASTNSTGAIQGYLNIPDAGINLSISKRFGGGQEEHSEAAEPEDAFRYSGMPGSARGCLEMDEAQKSCHAEVAEDGRNATDLLDRSRQKSTLSHGNEHEWHSEDMKKSSGGSLKKKGTQARSKSQVVQDRRQDLQNRPPFRAVTPSARFMKDWDAVASRRHERSRPISGSVSKKERRGETVSRKDVASSASSPVPKKVTSMQAQSWHRHSKEMQCRNRQQTAESHEQRNKPPGHTEKRKAVEIAERFLQSRLSRIFSSQKESLDLPYGTVERDSGTVERDSGDSSDEKLWHSRSAGARGHSNQSYSQTAAAMGRSESARAVGRSQSAHQFVKEEAKQWKDERSDRKIAAEQPAGDEWESGVLDMQKVPPKPWSQILASHVIIERDSHDARGPVAWDAVSEGSASSGIRLN